MSPDKKIMKKYPLQWEKRKKITFSWHVKDVKYFFKNFIKKTEIKY